MSLMLAMLIVADCAFNSTDTVIKKQSNSETIEYGNPKLWEKIKRKFGSRQKKYGFGWGFPITWQGWTVLLSYNLLILIGSKSVVSADFKL